MDHQTQTVILDISSDDEATTTLDDSLTADNFGWISKLLEEDDNDEQQQQQDNVIFNNYDSISGGVIEQDYVTNGGVDDIVDDDCDDVVVVGEVIAKSNNNSNNLGLAPKCGDVDDDDGDDDDCVVLDGDPDKEVSTTTTVSKTTEDFNSCDEDSDELVIVGEKGHVACRDYPHSRHLCTKYPLNSTPHQSHCDLCHCYVCDSLAPCAYWGSGVSGVDHCHATDKEVYWQLERKKVRQSKNPSVPINKPPVPVPVPARHPRYQQTSARAHPVYRAIPTSGVSTSFGVPNIISQHRNYRSTNVVSRNRFQPHLVSRQLLRTCNSSTQTQTSTSSTVAPSLVASRPIFKRPGVANRLAPGPPSNVRVAYLQLLNHQQLARNSTENNSINSTVSSSHLDMHLSSCQPTTTSISMGGLPSQFQGYSQPSALTPTSRFQGYGVPGAVTSDSPYVYTSGNGVQNDPSLFIPCISSNGLSSVTQSSQQNSVVTENVCDPNFACGASDGLSSITEGIQQPLDTTQHTFVSSNFPCNTSNTLNSVAQSCQQSPTENHHAQGVVPMHDLLPPMEHNSQISGSTNSSSLDLEFDSWLHDNEPTIGAQEGCYMFGGVDNQSSMPAQLDAGMLYFDFDTSWKGLAHS